MSSYMHYKPSGVEWLGDIPAHWDMWKATHIFSQIGSGTTPNSTEGIYYEGNIPWVTTSELREQVITETKQKITEEALKVFSSLKIYQEGSIAIAMYGATIGRVGILGIPATVNQACCVFGHSPLMISRFFFYWLCSVRTSLISLSLGGGQPNLSQDILKQLQIPKPPLEEQKAIVSFLDDRTAQVDALIAKKQRLLNLLAEKRSALITQAVTKGLNPNTPLKPSGVKWLGDIPAHWEVISLKRVVNVFGRIGFRGYTTNDIVSEGEGALSISPSNIENGNFVLTKKTYISWEKYFESPEIQVFPRDLLFVKTGSTIGKIAIVEEANEAMTINPQLVVLKQPTVEHIYLYFLMSSKFYQAQVKGYIFGGSTPAMNQEDIGNTILLCPPFHEQKEISTFLIVNVEKIARVENALNKMINKLKEYRSALITSAVTGKIDVCATAPKELLTV